MVDELVAIECWWAARLAAVSARDARDGDEDKVGVIWFVMLSVP